MSHTIYITLQFTFDNQRVEGQITIFEYSILETLRCLKYRKDNGKIEQSRVMENVRLIIQWC